MTTKELVHGKRSTYIRKKCRCEACCAAENSYQRARYHQDLDKHRALARAHTAKYLEENRDIVNARARAANAANPEPARAKRRRHYVAHPEYYQRKDQEWRKQHPESSRVRSREGWRSWEERNPEANKAAKQRWVRTNQQAAREIVRRRRARLRCIQVVKFSAADLTRRLSMWPGCWMCGGAKEAVDHVKPISKGGAHMLSNLRPACCTCNSRKCGQWNGPRWAMALPGRAGK